MLKVWAQGYEKYEESTWIMSLTDYESVEE